MVLLCPFEVFIFVVGYASNPLNIDDSFEQVGHGDIAMIMKTKMN